MLKLFSAIVGAAIVALAAFPAAAQDPHEEFVKPRRLEVDWGAVNADAKQLVANVDTSSERFRATLAPKVAKLLDSFRAKDSVGEIALLNVFTEPFFPGIASTPLPVLLPVRTADLIHASTQNAPGPSPQPAPANSIERLQFIPGRSGYDAILTLSRDARAGAGVDAGTVVQVHLGGLGVAYPGGNDEGEPVAELRDQFRDLRRSINGSELTYAFERFGANYFVNVDCAPATADASLDCAKAEMVLKMILADLALAGGAPVGPPSKSNTAAPRPKRTDPKFRYYAPGNLLAGTSHDNRGGDPSKKLYEGRILFPIKRTPAFANSQVFMHGGNCVSPPGTTDNMIPLPKKPGDTHFRYHCNQNDKPLLFLEGHPENSRMPWRDNYCESRPGGADRPSGCPLERGHAGQDLRPASCAPVQTRGEKCRIDVFEVVAVVDGKAWWKDGSSENNMRLMFDDESAHMYFVYLHMSPSAMWNAGMVKGISVPVTKGQPIGMVGNFDKTEVAGTSTHLHFEIRTPSPKTGVGRTVSPYWTLVRAYERHIGARGVELK